MNNYIPPMTPKKYPEAEKNLQAKVTTLLDMTAKNATDPITTANAMFCVLVSFWQLGARPNKFNPPSIIFIDPEESPPNTMRQLRDALFCSQQNWVPEDDEPKSICQKPHTYSIENAPRQMEIHYKIHRHRSAQNIGLTFSTEDVKLYHEAKKIAFGNKVSYHYKTPWHPELGLIANERGSVILHLSTTNELEAFRDDLLNDPKKLTAPQGPSEDLSGMESKKVCLTGSIPASAFDAELVDRTLALGLPYLFLPHTGKAPQMPNPGSLWMLADEIKEGDTYLLAPKSSIPDIDEATAEQQFIWERLLHMPANARYPYLEILHQLEAVVMCILNSARQVTHKFEPLVDVDKQSLEADGGILSHLLYRYAVRSLAVSLKTLAWHGLGFHLSCPLDTARQVLETLRIKGPASLRDIQRSTPLKNRAIRDEVLSELQAEHLVIIEDKVVSAVSWSDFTRLVHSTPDLTPVPTLSRYSSPPAEEHTQDPT